jgi:folate-binding protein YgfZ
VAEAFFLDRDVIRARGTEALSYLQGQLSQDLFALADGQSSWSWLLAPNGKVDALLRVTRLDADEWLLDTDAGYGEAVRARLDRFKLRTKVEFSTDGATVVRFSGPAPDGLDAIATIPSPWPGLDATDVITSGPVDAAPAAEYERLRIAAGIPRMGAEFDERTIPAESGLIDLTVSFTKGCYTGQELVARVDSRGGNAPRHLTRLHSSGELATGSDLLDDGGATAGKVTSAAALDDGGWVALGFVKRGIEPDRVLYCSGRPVEQVVPGR